jgi:hypothetical protein
LGPAESCEALFLIQRDRPTSGLVGWHKVHPKFHAKLMGNPGHVFCPVLVLPKTLSRHQRRHADVEERHSGNPPGILGDESGVQQDLRLQLDCVEHAAWGFKGAENGRVVLMAIQGNFTTFHDKCMWVMAGSPPPKRPVPNTNTRFDNWWTVRAAARMFVGYYEQASANFKQVCRMQNNPNIRISGTRLATEFPKQPGGCKTTFVSALNN